MLTLFAFHQEYIRLFYSYYEGDGSMPGQVDVKVDEKLATAIQELWQDEGMQECFMRSSEYLLSDSAE